MMSVSLTGEYIQLANQLDDILQEVLQIGSDTEDPQVSVFGELSTG